MTEPIILKGVPVYFCSITTDNNIQYTKIILENEVGDVPHFKILKIITKKEQAYVFPSVENLKNQNVLVKIDRNFYYHSIKNESSTPFIEAINSPVIRMLETKSCVNYAFDATTYDFSSQQLLFIVPNPENKQTKLVDAISKSLEPFRL